MARGNDAAEARRELEGRLGSELNAEALVQANKKRYPAELRSANSKRIDRAATEALDPDAVEKAVQEALDDKDVSLVDDENGEAFVVRGESVVALYDDGTGVGDNPGRVEKIAVALDEVGGHRKARAESSKAKAAKVKAAKEADEQEEK